MKIDRDKYLKQFSMDRFPKFKCPKCNDGYLSFSKDLFLSKTTPSSERGYDFIGEVSILDLRYVAILQCGNTECGEFVSMSGTGCVDEQMYSDEDGEEQTKFTNYFDVRYMHPPVNIIENNEKYPSAIFNLLTESFGLFWTDPSSTGNKIRNTIECIMDDLDVEAEAISPKGKNFSLSLHQRIEQFGVIRDCKYKDLSTLLFGLKWLGNAGSHKDILSREDILDAYEILNHILYEIYIRDYQAEDVEKTAHKLVQKYKR